MFLQEELEGKDSSEESESSSEEQESSDDEHTWTKEVKKQHRIISREHRQKELREAFENGKKDEETAGGQPKLYELRQGEEYKGMHSLNRKLNKYVYVGIKNEINSFQSYFRNVLQC